MRSGGDDLAKPNPSALVGKLPNGLRYTILQHSSHNKESIQLFMDAGSRDETDQEQGIAHFIEHMAFVGPKSFPKEELPQQFAKAGIAWGRDQNAFTTYFGTTYTLNINEVDGAKLDLSFEWLRDVTDGLRFDPDSVERERGVVLQEYIRGQGPARDLATRAGLFSLPNLRGAYRPSIGTEATIKAADAGTLKDFYERWYRPENTIVAVVGDEPVAVIKRRIEATFGRWRAVKPNQPRFDPGAVDLQRATDVLAIAEPKLPSVVQVCRYREKDAQGAEGVASHRLTLADQIWSTAFALRVQSTIQSASPPFLSATVGRSEPYRVVGSTCVLSVPLNDDWEETLKAVSTEIRRMSLYGVTQREFDYAKAQISAGLDQVVVSYPTQDAAPIASNILFNYAEQGTFDTPGEDRRIQLKALSQLDPKSVGEMFRRRWDEASPPLITVVTPKAVSANDVQQAWKAALAGPPPGPPIDRSAAPWAYNNFGPSGSVIGRDVMSDPDFVRLTFANGVILNFKQTAFAKGQISIRVRFGAGQQEIEPGEIYNAAFGATLLMQGGLGKNSFEDLIDVCKGRSCSVSLSVGRTAFELSGSTRPEDLGLELQILTAFLTDPGFSATVDKRIPSSVHAVYRQIGDNPTTVAALAFSKALPEPHVIDQPSEAVAAAATTSIFRRLLEIPLKNDALEVTMVGDVDEHRATELIASTFGALPVRKRQDHTRADAVHAVFAPVLPAAITALHTGPKDKAAIILSWPLYVWAPERVHEGRVLNLLNGVFKDEIIERVRRKLGQTYSPGVTFSVHRGGDQGALVVVLETSPKNVDAVIAEVEEIASNLAGGDITPAALELTRKPLLDGYARQRTYNGWWLGELDGSYEHPENLFNTRTWDHDMATIGLDEVKAEARRWLKQRPMVAVSLPTSASTP